MANKFTDKLQKYFNLGFKKNAKRPSEMVFPLKDDPKKSDKSLNKGEIPAKIKEIFPSNVQGMFDWWMSDNHYSMESWKTITALFRDCDLMFMNNGIMSRAAEIMADEVVQVDTATQPILIEAKRKQKKFITEFFDKINIYNYLRPAALSIIKYGNAGWVLSYDDKGIDEIVPTNIYSLNERLEFSPFKIKEMMSKKNNFIYDYKSKVHRIDQLVNMITNKDNVASYFKNYLFGFVVGDYTLPPWRFLHFRNYDNESPFNPFGVPVFIYSLGPYMQLDAGMTLQVAARGASFPRDVYKITMPESMPPSEKLAAALEFSRELQNSGINAVVKEKNGVGEVFITIEGLYEYSQETPDIDLGKMGDLEMLRDDLILSTLLPRYMIDPNDGGFGDSGVAMVEKWKPFARSIYRIQSRILEQITQLVKIEMINSQEFALDEIDFILKMPYPESQTSDELIRSQTDLLNLSNEIIDALSDKFMGGEQLPNDVKKDIYKKFLPYDDNMLDQWLKTIEKNKDDNSDDKDNDEKEVDESGRNKLSERKLLEIWHQKEKAIGKYNLKEQINNLIFDKKQSSLREGSLRGTHYYSSKNIVKEFSPEWLVQFRKEDVKNNRISLKEELENEEMEFKPKKYKFNSKK